MKVLMLDADGVLVRNEAEDFVRDAALDLTLATARSRLSAEQWKAIGTGRADLGEVLATVMPDRELVERLIAYGMASETHIDPDMLAAVGRIRAGGVRIFLATNQENRRARYLMETLGLGREFDGILHSAGLGYRKPDAEYFAVARERAGVLPEEIVFIDDSARNVDAARRAGWTATHWQGDLSLEEAIAAAR